MRLWGTLFSTPSVKPPKTEQSQLTQLTEAEACQKDVHYRRRCAFGQLWNQRTVAPGAVWPAGAVAMYDRYYSMSTIKMSMLYSL